MVIGRFTRIRRDGDEGEPRDIGPHLEGVLQREVVEVEHDELLGRRRSRDLGPPGRGHEHND